MTIDTIDTIDIDVNNKLVSIIGELSIVDAIRHDALSFEQIALLDLKKFTQAETRSVIIAIKKLWQIESEKPTKSDLVDQLVYELSREGISCDAANSLVDEFEEAPPKFWYWTQEFRSRLEYYSSNAVDLIKPAANDQDDESQQDADLIDICKDSPLAAFAAELAKSAQMPRNTTFLTVLSIFSAAASRAAVVCYRNGKAQPLGIFFCAEQPPATSKSRILNSAQDPFFGETKAARKELKKQLAELQDALQDEAADTKKIKKEIKEVNQKIASLFDFITDATPEALDMTLSETGGFYSIASAEQAAINTLLGLSYKDTKNESNKDLILKAYNGEYHYGKRKGREAYCGHVVGSICVLGQSGMIKNILSASGASGLVERFMLWAEPHFLGERDHLNYYSVDEYIQEMYSNASCDIYKEVAQGRELEELTRLHLSDRSWLKLSKFRQELEPTLANGAENSAPLLRGVIGKIDILIMKISGVLHMARLSKPSDTVVMDQCVDQAISIAKAYISHIKALVLSSQVEALSDQEREILDYIGAASRTGKQIADKLYRKAAFKTKSGVSRAAVQSAVLKMVKSGVLKMIADKTKLTDFNHARFSCAE